MNNTSLTSADATTHLKVVVVSLVAAILVVGVGVAARTDMTDGGTSAGTSRLEAKGPVIRAGQPVTFTARETAPVR